SGSDPRADRLQTRAYAFGGALLFSSAVSAAVGPPGTAAVPAAVDRLPCPAHNTGRPRGSPEPPDRRATDRPRLRRPISGASRANRPGRLHTTGRSTCGELHARSIRATPPPQRR